MLLHVTIEVVLGAAMLFAGQAFWQLLKRKRFLEKALRTPAFLESLISRERLTNPPPRLLPFLQKSEHGYALNMKVLMDVDRASQRRVTMFHAAVIVMIIVAGYLLGVVYFTINVLLFFLLAYGPTQPSVRFNSAEHIFTVGLILYRWRLGNIKECDEFVERSPGLRPLYDAIRKVQ
jgi:hypothetical protein